GIGRSLPLVRSRPRAGGIPTRPSPGRADGPSLEDPRRRRALSAPELRRLSGADRPRLPSGNRIQGDGRIPCGLAILSHSMGSGMDPGALPRICRILGDDAPATGSLTGAVSGRVSRPAGPAGRRPSVPRAPDRYPLYRPVLTDLEGYLISHFSPKKSAATGFLEATSIMAQSGSVGAWRALVSGDWSWTV